jgi:NAD(P)-dependent dehydrogenase (short-subunit alcohol dehydrogenase family)
MDNKRITTRFGAQSTATEVIAGIDLGGRRVIVTGGASGIGVETARALAAADAEVTLAVRNLAAGEHIAEENSAPSSRSGTSHGHHGQQACPRRRPARPRRSDVGRGVRRQLGRAAAHPGQQCRHHGPAGASCPDLDLPCNFGDRRTRAC